MVSLLFFSFSPLNLFAFHGAISMPTFPNPYLRTRATSAFVTYLPLVHYDAHGYVGTSTYPAKTHTSVMQDWATPFYRERVKLGEIVNHGCLMTATKTSTEANGSVRYTKGGLKHYWDGCVTQHFKNVGGPNWPSDPYGNPHPFINKEAAKQKALVNVDKTPYEFIEDIGEIKETIDFSRKPLDSIHQLSKEFKRDVRKKMRKRKIPRTKALASTWLSYRFALLPLLGSAYNIYESINTRYVKKPTRRTARGFVYEVLDNSRKTKSGTISTVERHYEVHYRCGAGVAYRVYNPAGAFRETYGLRAQDIPKGLWNLLPLSFMVDRLVDISSSLAALRVLSDPNVEFEYGFVTSRFTSQKTSYLRKLSYADSVVSGNPLMERKFYYIRENWTPSFFDAAPLVDLTGLFNSITRITDLGSIIIQNLKG